ncbi:acylphosphatase [Humitalea rosea]|uniref:Acylphosphatase n=1 Tax=Humitalea rosea TaxID=990373 RepID=A0A2W7IWS8_9PROT|nr:acylphosphatase [Humitalea rosea]PZW43153.1 acylphosphatase [Humitalea rosea]
MIARHLLISGRVQGVGFRHWLERAAREAGVSGWVRNRAGGEVEAVLAGDPTAVARLVARCRGGPPGADVAALAEAPAEMPTGDGFRRLPSL